MVFVAIAAGVLVAAVLQELIADRLRFRPSRSLGAQDTSGE